MARNYATSADYQSYTGQTPPADIDARLGRASRFLDSDVFRLCWFEADEDGYPSNAIVAEPSRQRCARRCSGGRRPATSWGPEGSGTP